MHGTWSAAAEGGRRGIALLLLALGGAQAVESDPLPVPPSSVRANAVSTYNEGVQRLLTRDFVAAQELFQQALRLDDTLAEAHNNLAYALRMQSPAQFALSLRHYDRAIELKPTLAQAYMYRGVLFTQMGDRARAHADLVRLRALDPAMAEQLERAIASPPGETRPGIAAQFDY